MGFILNTSYKVQADLLESESNINIENGTLHVIDNKLKVHLNDEIKTIQISNYKVFTALLTQSGTEAPVATVLDNTIGNIWFTYDSVGNYFVNSDGLFIENKSWTPTILIFNDTAGIRDGEICEIRRENSNQYNILTFDQSGTNINNQLNNTPIEIRIYN